MFSADTPITLRITSVEPTIANVLGTLTGIGVRRFKKGKTSYLVHEDTLQRVGEDDLSDTDDGNCGGRQKMKCPAILI